MKTRIPAALAAVVQVQFDELLDTLDVSTLLPSAELQAIDDTYRAMIELAKAGLEISDGL